MDIRTRELREQWTRGFFGGTIFGWYSVYDPYIYGEKKEVEDILFLKVISTSQLRKLWNVEIIKIAFVEGVEPLTVEINAFEEGPMPSMNPTSRQSASAFVLVLCNRICNESCIEPDGKCQTLCTNQVDDGKSWRRSSRADYSPS